MVNTIIADIKRSMQKVLNNEQLVMLDQVLEQQLASCIITPKDNVRAERLKVEKDYVKLFLSAKKVEGCSDKSIYYYHNIIKNLLTALSIPVNHLMTDDIREYLSEYQLKHNVSKVTVDNIRRVLSSFFTWLETENYILKNPVRRIHKVKTRKLIKETYSDEMMEIIRDNCNELRDLALIDLLSSTGIRVGELVKLNRNDIDFLNRECVVLGKGDKERIVYFDARTKLHLQNYLAERTDCNEALFVSLLKPYSRLKISGVEIRLRELGHRLKIGKLHPHKFRRTLATRAIDKGMPIEQVQLLLGHSKIDTT